MKYRVRYDWYDDPNDSWSTNTTEIQFTTLEDAIDYCKKNDVSLGCISKFNETTKHWEDMKLGRY